MSGLQNIHLIEMMVECFSIEELKTLCFKLDLEYENVSVGGREEYARELILYCKRIDRFDDLIDLCEKERPHLSWREKDQEISKTKTLRPKNKMVELLHLWDEWEGVDIGNSSNAYHQEHANYRIQFDKPKEIPPEAFSFAYQNQYTHLSQANFYYGSTPLFEIAYVLCDHMRIVFPDPEPKVILPFSSNKIYYHYLEIDSVKGAFLNLLSKGTLSFKSRSNYAAPILVYSDSEEREKFEKYVVENLEDVNTLAPHVLMEHQQSILLDHGRWGSHGYDLVFLEKMKRSHKVWKNEQAL